MAAENFRLVFLRAGCTPSWQGCSDGPQCDIHHSHWAFTSSSGNADGFRFLTRSNRVNIRETRNRTFGKIYLQTSTCFRIQILSDTGTCEFIIFIISKITSPLPCLLPVPSIFPHVAGETDLAENLQIKSSDVWKSGKSVTGRREFKLVVQYI
jgi:hypothetical protein